jgi:hypothetical protein
MRRFHIHPINPVCPHCGKGVHIRWAYDPRGLDIVCVACSKRYLLAGVWVK